MTEIEYELYHHGVKGMKWGKRQAKYESRVQKKLDKAGRKLGQADYERRKGAEEYSEYDKKAKEFERAARAREKYHGDVLGSTILKQRAANARAQGEAAKRSREEAAEYLERSAARMQQRVSKYATKKQVNLGKSKVNSIINAGRKTGAKKAEEYEIREREYEASKREFDEWINRNALRDD